MMNDYHEKMKLSNEGNCDQRLVDDDNGERGGQLTDKWMRSKIGKLTIVGIYKANSYS